MTNVLVKKEYLYFQVKQFDKKTDDYNQKELKAKDRFLRTIVLGPPGTGKTTTLLNKVDSYLKNTDPDKIGYFAFTQKAAHEARDRQSYF